MIMNATRSGIAIRAAFLAATAILFLAEAGHAQSYMLRATMPFSFYAGEQLLPAGEYEITAIGNGAVKISNYDAHKSAVFFTVGLNRVTANPISPRLVFNRYSDDYFLSEMWWGENQGKKSMPSKRENELAKTLSPDQAVTLAHR
jgi:hypothetical protein